MGEKVAKGRIQSKKKNIFWKFPNFGLNFYHHSEQLWKNSFFPLWKTQNTNNFSFMDEFTHFKKGFFFYIGHLSILWSKHWGQSECINVTGETEDKWEED